MSEEERSAKVWKQHARRLAWKFNFAWLMDRLSPRVILLALIASVAVLCVRTFYTDLFDSKWILIGFPLLVLAAAGLSWLKARQFFIGEREGLVRLEDRMGLNNALSSAESGHAGWPSAPQPGASDPRGNSGLRWNWAWAAAPTIIALFMVVGAVLIPFPDLEAAAVKLPPSEPGAWDQMDDWLETLEEEDLIEEPAIEEYVEKISELRDQPEDEWFSHSSMEATDNLRENLQKELNNLASEMGTLERDLSALQNFSAEMSADAKEMLMKEYDEALTELTTGNLALNEALRKQLEGLDPAQLSEMNRSQLSKEQIEALKKSLCEGCQAIGGMEGLGGKDGEGKGETLEEMLARLAKEGKLGRGGVNRGPGEAPLFFGEESDLETNRIEGVQNEDFSRALPGDVLGTGETEHDPDETSETPRVGGAVGSSGSGGETVWKESLMPAEKAVLKKYFK